MNTERRNTIYLIFLLLAAGGLFSGCAELFARRESAEWRRPRTDDVAVGMKMEDVSRAWGEPRQVFSAGDPNEGNQKWVYSSTATGPNGAARVIYFEQGRVAGWRSNEGAPPFTP